MAEGRWVGRDIAQVDIDDKLLGSTRYIADLKLPRMLHGSVVRSPVAHGIIRHIDCSRASRVPGVRAVATAADTLRKPFGPYVPDWEILATHKVRCIGDEVAAVAATSMDAAREAADLVRVEIEELPPVFDAQVALAEQAPVIWDERPDNISSNFSIARGDAKTAFDEADHVFSDTYSTNRIYHAYLEPVGVIADRHDNGSFTLHVPTHIPHKARLTYATALGVSSERIRIVVPPIGGSFGAKYEMTVPLIAAVLSRQTGCPVRIVFEREEDAGTAHPRPPFVFHHRMATSANGDFLGRETDVVGTAGARTYWAPTVLATAVHRVDSLYNFRNMSGRGRLVYTNESPTTCMRGFGNAESLFGVEQMIDDIAETLDVDPVELRLRNAVRSGDTTLHGWRISSSELPACLTRAAELSNYKATRVSTRRQRGHRGIRTGMGLAIGHHVSGYRTILNEYDGSAAILRMGMGGEIALYVGEPDLGQGQSTVLAQTVAEVLGCEPEDVILHSVDSDLSPAAVGTLASRATTIAGMAARNAAEAARARLGVSVAEQWKVEPSDLEFSVGRVRSRSDESLDIDLPQACGMYGAANCGLPLIGEGVYRPPTEIPDAEKYGNPSAAYPFAAHIARVTVDCASGRVRVDKYWAVHDSGRIINPSTARSQVLGAIAQGVGWALMEDLDVVEGRVRNPNFLDYRIPGAGDMPDATVEFVSGFDPHGPYGAKSLGEVAINPVAAAIANAVYDATGVRCKRLPLSPERLWRLLSGETEALVEPAVRA